VAAGPVSGVGFRARLRSLRWDCAPCLARHGGRALKDVSAYLLHMRDAINRALAYAEPGRDAFMADPMRQALGDWGSKRQPRWGRRCGGRGRVPR